jgi:hypothetical protein
VTEKVVEGFASTSLPVYMGAPNIDDFLPHPHSVIKTDDFESPQALAVYLHQLLEDETEYNSYFEWKSLPPEQWKTPKSEQPRSCKYCDRSWHCRACLRLHGLL